MCGGGIPPVGCRSPGVLGNALCIRKGCSLVRECSGSLLFFYDPTPEGVVVCQNPRRGCSLLLRGGVPPRVGPFLLLFIYDISLENVY